MKKIFGYILLSFCLFINTFGFAQNDKNITVVDSLEIRLATASATEKINLYLELGQHFNYSSIEKSIRYYRSALLLAQDLNDTEKQFTANNRLGRCYEYLGIYNTSLEYYYESLTISEKSGDLINHSISLIYVSSIFQNIGNYDKALKHLNSAQEKLTKANNKRLLPFLHINIGLVYMKKENYFDAKKHFQIALDRSIEINHIGNKTACHNNLGLLYLQTKEFDKSLEHFGKANKLYTEKENQFGLAEINNNYGRLYISLKEYEKAEEYLIKAKEIAESISAKGKLIHIYENFAKLYDELNNPEKSLKYQRLFEAENEDVLSSELRGKISKMETLYETDKRDNKIQLLEDESRINTVNLIIYIVIFSLVIIIGFLLYFKQKNKSGVVDYEDQKEILKAKLENTKLEKKQLEDELKFKTRELTNFALHIVQKNNILEDIKNSLKKIEKDFDGEEKQLIRKLEFKIDNTLQNKEELEKFQNNIEQINYEFLFRLQKRFPELTSDEINLAALLRLKLSSKEIASIYKTSVRAIEMRRFRMRKKLEIDSNELMTKILEEL